MYFAHTKKRKRFKIYLEVLHVKKAFALMFGWINVPPFQLVLVNTQEIFLQPESACLLCVGWCSNIECHLSNKKQNICCDHFALNSISQAYNSFT